MFGYVALLFSLGDFAIAIGLSRSQSTNIIGLLNVGTAIGRPIIGIWSDKFKRVDVAAILTIVCGISCFAFWLPAMGYGLTIFFALLIGAILGVFWMVSFACYKSSLPILIRILDHRTTLCGGSWSQRLAINVVNILARDCLANDT